MQLKAIKVFKVIYLITHSKSCWENKLLAFNRLIKREK